MENYTVVLVIMALMIVVSGLADKIKLPVPVLLLIAGIGIGFLPAMPDVELNPEIVMLLFLPPLLYDAAFNISFKDFRTNINTISTLAIGLVFLTTAELPLLLITLYRVWTGRCLLCWALFYRLQMLLLLSVLPGV